MVGKSFPRSNMDLLSLNEDVILAIVSAFDPDDARRFAQASRLFRSIALQQAFSVVTLTTSRQLTGFCEYMLQYTSTHILLLRELNLLLYYNIFSLTAPLLADVLEKAGRIRSICIWDADRIMRAEPRVGDAISSLQDLQDIQLHGAYTGVHHFLSTLQSRPSRVSIFCSGECNENGHADRVALPISHLQSLQHAEFLEFSDVAFIDDMPPRTREDHYAGPQWSAVQHLALLYTQIPATVLTHAFPNVKCVQLCTWPDATPCVAVDTTDSSQVPWSRARAIHWMTLDVTWLSLSSSENDIKRALSALRCLRPVVLTIAVFALRSLLFWTLLAELVPQLEYLDLRLSRMHGSLVPISMRDWLRDIPPVIGQLKVTCIRVSVQDWYEMYHEEVRDALVAHVSSLRYLAVRPVHNEDEWSDDTGYTWWSVENTGDATEMVEIPHEVGEAVHEHLHSYVRV